MNESPTPPRPDDEPTAGIGHNNPPEPLPYDETEHDELSKLTGAFLKVSDDWLTVKVSTPALAEQLTDQIGGLRKLWKRIDDQRVAAKKPHDDRAAAVQKAYKPLLDRVSTAAGQLKVILEAYARRLADEARAQREKEMAAARALEEEARLKAIDAQNSGSIEDSVAAAEAAKEAEKRSAAAARPVNTGIKSASGAGRTMAMRARKSVEITNIRHLFMHYQNRPEVAELLKRLATGEANAAGFPKDGKIPGTEITIIESLA